MLTIIIPVLNQLERLTGLMLALECNDVKPDRIILVDNGSTEDISRLIERLSDMVTYIRLPENIGTNGAWNIGIKEAKTKYVMFLNTDILIENFFIKKILTAAENNETSGVIFGETVADLVELDATNDEAPKSIKLSRFKDGAGWAFMMRKADLDIIGPIPGELKIFFGDDYLWHGAALMGAGLLKVTNANVYHFGGRTIKAEFDKSEMWNIRNKVERPEWYKIKNSMNLSKWKRRASK